MEYKGNLYPSKYVISIANRYANGEELSSNKFGGGDETIKFIESRGFSLRKKSRHKFDDDLIEYLKNKFSKTLRIEKDKRSWLRIGENIIYVNGSIILDGKRGFYDLESSIFKQLIEKG